MAKPSEQALAGARRHLALDGEFEMRCGGVLESPTIAYETWGTLNHDASNAASSPEDPSPGWWEEMLGPDRPIDTHSLFVICINSLGSCFGSTGPASKKKSGKGTYNIDFPVLSLEDIANSAVPVLDHLGVRQLFAVIGCSMGGMSALAFAVQHPDRSGGRLLSVSSAARAAPFAIALRSLQREMVRKDPDWQGGRYAPGAGPINGMRMARKLGMVSYRSAEEWAQRFGRERVAAERTSNDPFCIDFEVESYLEAHAQKFTGGFDPNCYLFLSRAMDLFDVADYGGSVLSGVRRARLDEALVIGVTTDILFPVWQHRE